SIQASKLTNENLNLNSPVPLINEQTSDSISINNEQSSNSVIDISESFLPIPIPEFGKKIMIVEKQRNTYSKCSGCPWVINATYPKKTGIISITSLYLEHEDHPLDPLTKKFGLTHRTLTEPMLADIEFWTTNGNLNLSNAIQRVKAEQNINYPATNSLVSLFWMMPKQYELYLQYSDIIQYDNTYSTNKFKMALGLFVIVNNNNWSRLIGQMLMNNETLESLEWVFDSLIKGTDVFPSVIIDAAITNIMPNTYHIHCIYHIEQNLLKNLKSKLESEYNDFIKAWYKIRNTISQTEFDYLWDSLLEQYPALASYLNRSLGSQKYR
ncbi:20050_t:CDS:2, partial [Dentiscutata erythropus]